MKARTTGTYALIAVAVIATVAVVLFRSLSVEAVYPIERAKLILGRTAWPWVTGLFTGARAKVENVSLRREVASLALVRQDMERLEAENARLRRALGYASRNPGEWLSASVLSSGGGAAGSGKTLRTDKGSLDGVMKDAVVVVPDGLVGIVTSVTPHTSEIRLITDVNVKVACEVEVGERPRPRGILMGGTDESLVLRHITDADSLIPRARVLTSGLGGVYPKGLEVGVWLGLEGNGADGALVREGAIQPSVDFEALEDVFIRREK